MRRSIVLASILSCGVSFSGAAHARANDGRTLLSSRCAECHAEDSRYPIPFRDEVAFAARLRAASATDPARTLKEMILLRLRSNDPDYRMPQDQVALSPGAIAEIERYLNRLSHARD